LKGVTVEARIPIVSEVPITGGNNEQTMITMMEREGGIQR